MSATYPRWDWRAQAAKALRKAQATPGKPTDTSRTRDDVLADLRAALHAVRMTARQRGQINQLIDELIQPEE